MPKKSSKNFDKVASRMMKRGIIGSPPSVPDKNPAAVSLGSRGGKARADALTPARRKAIAKKAARKRWG